MGDKTTPHTNKTCDGGRTPSRSERFGCDASEQVESPRARPTTGTIHRPDRRGKTLRRGRISVGLLAAASILPFGIGVPDAGAASEIEGIWSFNGGEVAIHDVAGGKFEGVVVSPTKFAECTHQAGEHMWTEMTKQPDGSYFGYHRWLFSGSCQPNPEPGPTAWRVLRTATGARLLEVCFSEPGKSQPTIAASGAGANASFGCVKSSPTAALPVIVSGKSDGGAGEAGAERISFANTILLPGAHQCVRRGTLTIKIKDPRHDPLKEVVIRIGKRKVADVRGVKRLGHAIVLRHLPRGSYTLKIAATTVLDQKLTGRRRYRACRRGHTRHPLELRRGVGRKHR